MNLIYATEFFKELKIFSENREINIFKIQKIIKIFKINISYKKRKFYHNKRLKNIMKLMIQLNLKLKVQILER